MPDKIQCMVGDQERIVDMDVFIDAHQWLADHFRAKGLSGDALDVAINEMLPLRLSQILDKVTIH